jgi:hypothetical protein
MRLSIAIITALAATFAVPALAQQNSNSFSASDVHTLLTAVSCELSPQCKHIEVTFVSPSHMPAYDPLVHYVGLASDPQTAVVWVSQAATDQPAQSAAMKKALLGAMLLACMDDGEAGTTWKNIYNSAAAADATLPAGSPDPYLNRHKLVEAIEVAVGSH